MIKIDIKIGDTILTGKWKNKKVVVKEIGEDEFGSPTINGKSILKIRIPKLYQKENTMKNIKLKNLIKEEKIKVTKFTDWSSAISILRRGDLIYVDTQTNKDWSNEYHKDFNKKTLGLDIVSSSDRHGGEYLYAKDKITASEQNSIDDFLSDVWYKSKKFEG